MLENPFQSGQTPASMDTQYLMSLKHILQAGKAVEKLATSIRKMVREFMGG